MTTEAKLCNAPGCGRAARAKGLCTTHYRRQTRGASLEGPVQARDATPKANLTVRVPDNLRGLLQARADKAGHDLADEVRSALEYWVKR